MISITIQTEQPIPLVILTGRLDSTTSTEFDQTLRSLLEKEKYLIIDLSQCNYLSSAGIRILLVCEKKLVARSGCLFLCGLLPEVFQVIEMSGLHQIFRVFESPEAAIREFERIQLKASGFRQWSTDSFSFQFFPIENERPTALIWKNQGIVGYNELEVSIGMGSPAETSEEDKQSHGIFITSGRCAGFIPNETKLPSDFRIPQNPANAGVFVSQALSFGQQPTGLVRMSGTDSMTFDQLAAELHPMKQQFKSGHQDLMSLVVADFNPASPSVWFCLAVDQEMSDVFKKSEFDEIPCLSPDESGIKLWGAKFVLGDVPDAPVDTSLSNFLENTLIFENILNVEVIHPNDLVVNPMTWLFISDGLGDASKKRLHIETADDFKFEPHNSFLARRLYTDSARLIIKQIHGGYSAKTYQVTSFDRENRKLRPTVLKIADRAIITMKRKLRAILLFAAVYLIFFGSPLSAQTDSLKTVSVSANVDLVSRYIWRGLEIGHAPSIQPGLSATWRNFTLGAWGAYKLTGEGGQETDFYLSKSIGFVTVSICDYWIFNDTASIDFTDFHEKTTGHVLEAQALFSGGEKLPFNLLTTYFFYGADISKSIYLELQYVHKYSFADLAVIAGYQAKGTYYASKASFVNIGGTIKKYVAITDRFSLPVSFSLIANPAAGSVYLVAGISL